MTATKNDIQLIEFLSQNFYSLAQEIIEANYLQPLPQNNQGKDLPPKKKLNLKDGDLERFLHGGMHASRVQFWTLILNEKIKGMLPEYVKNVFDDLTKVLGLDEKQIITLLRYAALFHDSARKNEGQDKWDKDSAQKCHDFFIVHGLSTDLAEFFTQASALKDKPKDYTDFLLNKKIDSNYVNSFQYLRELIYLSDCFDIMRCTGWYDLKRTLRGVSFFQEDIHANQVIKIAEEIYHIIRKQKDMLFPCIILLPNNNFLNLGNSKSCFNLSHKVLFEHAENVCSAIGESIKEEDFFAKELENENFSSGKLSTIKPAFNPYIHGTSSLILPMLRRTNFTLLPSIEMLEQYGMAPMGGEIDHTLYAGGLDDLNPEKYICFGRMWATGDNEYNLEKVQSYTEKFPLTTPKSVTEKAKYYADLAFGCAYKNINKFLIYLARAKQFGCESLTKDQYEKAFKEINGIIQLHYLLMLIGKSIQPNFELYQKIKNQLSGAVSDTPEMRKEFEETIEKGKNLGIDFSDFTFERFLKAKKSSTDVIIDSIYEHFTFKKLVEKIIELGIDIKSIYENPNADNLAQILKILEFPKESEISRGLSPNKEKVTLPETQFFMLHKEEHSNDKSKKRADEQDIEKILSNDRGCTMESFFYKFLTGEIDNKFIETLEKIALHRIEVLEQKLNLFKKIAQINPEEVKFSAEELAFMQDSFPIILTCQSEEKISLCEFSTQEYRAHEPLKFGEDINIIATDTAEHQLLIMKFLEKNHIYNVQVLLIDQLSKSNENKTRPCSPYTDENGFLKLAFFAAKAVPVNSTIPEQAEEIIKSARQYQEIKLF